LKSSSLPENETILADPIFITRVLSDYHTFL